MVVNGGSVAKTRRNKVVARCVKKKMKEKKKTKTEEEEEELLGAPCARTKTAGGVWLS